MLLRQGVIIPVVPEHEDVMKTTIKSSLLVITEVVCESCWHVNLPLEKLGAKDGVLGSSLQQQHLGVGVFCQPVCQDTSCRSSSNNYLTTKYTQTNISFSSSQDNPPFHTDHSIHLVKLNIFISSRSQTDGRWTNRTPLIENIPTESCHRHRHYELRNDKNIIHISLQLTDWLQHKAL